MLVKNSLLLTVAGTLIIQSAALAGSTSHSYTDDKESAADSAKRQEAIYQKLDFISEMSYEMVDSSIILQALPVLTPPTVEGRLSVLKTAVPLKYNEQVQTYIDRYSTDVYRNYLSRMMGLGEYYFPIFEQVFEQEGLPKEIKYLSIVESALDPHAVSRVGATGPWQFMYATAKFHGLEMNRQIDERKDPVASSRAAARYLNELHERFGDWLLAIASYNCGPGNLLKAIKRSGLENPDYWAVQPFLPKETRNYVPAFIAMLYMLEYHEDFGIFPTENELALETEIINVQHSIPFSTIAEAIQVDESIVAKLNPAYKGGVVHGSVDQPRRLVLPEVSMEVFPTLYAVLHESHVLPAGQKQLLASATYTVRRGDTLSGIAKKYKGASVTTIKTANNLKSNRIQPGMKLIIRI